MKNKKTILAFSGGLDTSYCAVYLSKIKGADVHAITVNTGAFSDEEINEMAIHAKKLGAVSFTCLDERKNFYQQVIKFLVYGNVLKNNTYPLSVSAERIVQAIAIAAYAQEVNADFVVHGSTGAGNDQVRFDMIFNSMIPDIAICTPIRDHHLSREDEIAFLRLNGIKMDFEKAQYSINKGLWGTSIGGKETLNSFQELPETAYPTKLSRNDEVQVTLHFEQGELRGINEKIYDHPVDAIIALQELAGAFAIGRDMHVGDTIIGIKGRVGFEAAAPLIIIKAHHTLEKHVLTKWQLYWKDQLAAWYGNWLHEGQYLDPVMRDLEAFMQSTQAHVCGTVFVSLKPYRFAITGIESSYDLMLDTFGSYGEMNKSWSGDDVKGFAKIFGNQTFIHQQVKLMNQKNAKEN